MERISISRFRFRLQSQLAFKHLGWVLIIYYAILTLVSFLIFLHFNSHDHHWLNRVGGTIVVLSILLSFIQFFYERWMETRLAEDHSAQRWIDFGLSREEAERRAKDVANHQKHSMESSRLTILCNTLVTAALGELLHTYGDILFEFFG